MTRISAKPFFGLGLLIVLAGVLVARSATQVVAQEPTPPTTGPEKGQTPRPKSDEPLKFPSEAETVKLDTNLTAFYAVKDDAPFLFRGKEISTVKGIETANEELKAYEYTIEFAARQPKELLKKYADKKVPWGNLFGEIRRDYLRELLHVEGKMIFLAPFKPTDNLREYAKLETLYEAWIYPTGSPHLLCLVVPEIPAGVEPGENLNTWVSFDAYYFKFMRYESRQLKPKDSPTAEAKQQWRQAPLFIGRTFEVVPIQPVETAFFSGGMFYGVVGALLVLIGVGAALSYWFRRGDRAIKAASQRRIQEGVQFPDVAPGEPGANVQSTTAADQPSAE